MRPYQFNSILKEIKSGELAKGYYLSGDSQYMKDKALKTIREKLDLGSEDFNLDEFWANEIDDPKKVFDSLLSLPMMSDKRLIIINNIHSLPAKFKKELLSFDIPETSFLVMESPSPQRKQMDYHSKFRKKFKSFDFPPPYDNEYGYWIMEFAKEENKRIGGAALGLFTAKVSPSLLNIRSELQKLYSYIGERPEITREDIERVVSKSRTSTIFQFVDAFGNRNIKDCFKYSSELFDFGESGTMMLFWLTKRSIEMLKIRALSAKQATNQTISKNLRISLYWVKKYADQAKNYKVQEIIDFISILRESDMLIKSGKMGQREAVSYAIGKLATI